jgi:Tfp pilus assembly protein PilF
VPRRTGLLLLLLLSVVGALLVKRETLLERFPIAAPAEGGAVTVTKPPLPSAHADASSGVLPSIAPVRDSTDVQPDSLSVATPIAATPAVTDSGASTSTIAAELSQLAARKEGNGVALWLRLSSPVQYTLETGPKGEATLRLANVRLREGYLQAFDHDGPIHDVQVRHGDSGEVTIRFSLRTGISTGRTEITTADDGGYLLLVHCNNDAMPPAFYPDVPAATVLPPRLAGASTHTETKIHAKRLEERVPAAPESKRELQAQKTPAHIGHAGTTSRGHGTVESEQPGDFRKIARAAEPVDQKTKLYQSAVSALHAGDRARAQALAMQALEADGTAVAPRVLVVTMLMDDKRWPEARTQLETGLSQAPGNRDYKLLYARLLSETGEINQAAEVLAHDAPAPADDPDYHALLAALMQRAGRHDDAVVSYRRLLSVQPQNGLWWMGLGISLSATGQRQQAQDAFNRALTDRNLPDRLRQFLNDQLQQLHGASS